MSGLHDLKEANMEIDPYKIVLPFAIILLTVMLSIRLMHEVSQTTLFLGGL